MIVYKQMYNDAYSQHNIGLYTIVTKAWTKAGKSESPSWELIVQFDRRRVMSM